MPSIYDYQRCVANLRQCLKNIDRTSDANFTRLSEEYSQAIKDVNERLQECVGLIHQGMRATAIQQADIEPAVLSAFKILDIPEYEAWSQWAQEQNLPSELLDDDSAKILNQAYNTHNPLEPLLREYRKLALKRAPLALRLSLLRKIADADRNNLAWQEDLESFERARMEEIKAEIIPLQKEIDNAVSKANHEKLETLFADLTQPAWIEQPSQGLVNSVKKSLHKSSQRLLYDELVEIGSRLYDAFNEYNIETARDLRDQWDQTLDLCEIPNDDPILINAQSALSWIHEEDRREKEQAEVDEAIHTLETILDRKGLIGAVDTQIARATKHGHPLPEYLVERIEHYRLRLATRRKQKFILITTGLCAFLAGITVLGFYFLKQSHHIEQIDASVAKIQKLTDEKKWTAVLLAIENLSTAMRQDPIITDCANTAERQLKEIGRWKKKNAELITRVQNQYQALAAQYAKKQTGATPDNITAFIDFLKQIELLKQAIKNGNATLETSRDVLTGSADQSQILAQESEMGGLQSELVQLQSSLQAKLNALFRGRYEFFVKDFNAYTTDAEMQGLETLRDKIAKLDQTFAGNVDRKLSERLESLDDKIRAQLLNSDQIAQCTRALERLPMRVTNATAYGKALAQIIKDFPNDVRINDLKDAQRDMDQWKIVEDYQTIQKAYARIIAGRIIDYVQLSEWIDDATIFIDNYPSFPATNLLRKCITFLSPIAARSDAAIAAEDLQDHLDSRIYDDMHFIRIGPENYFISFDKPPKDTLGGKVIFFHFEDTDFDPGFVTRKVMPKQGLKKESPAPHCKLKNRLDKRLSKLLTGSLDKEEWETEHRKMLNDVLSRRYWKENEQESEAHPILRHQIIALILQLSFSGSGPMQDALQDSLEDFERTGLEIWTCNWVANDPTAINATNKAERDLRAFKAAAQALADKEKTLRKQGWSRRLPNYKPYGVILKDKSGNWTVRSDSASASLKGKLCVLDLGATIGKGFPLIGSVKSGVPSIDLSDGNLFYMGRPVFVELQEAK